MPVFRAWHSLSVFFVVFFLFFFLTPSLSNPTSSPRPYHPSPPLSFAPHSTYKHTQTDSSPPVSRPLPVLHPAINSLVYNAPRFLSVDNKMKGKQTIKSPDESWRFLLYLVGTSSSAFQLRWCFKTWKCCGSEGERAALLGKVKVDHLLLMC